MYLRELRLFLKYCGLQDKYNIGPLMANIDLFLLSEKRVFVVLRETR